jgi:TrmH family RNA methyltransferase
VFVVEGAKLLGCALDAGAPVESVFVGHTPDPLRPDEPGRPRVDVVTRAAHAGARVFDLAPGVLERVADTVTPQPVLAVVGAPAATLEDLAGSTFVVVCVDVRDPGNTGAVIRVAHAAGAHGVVCCEGTVDPFNPKTVRASAGSVLRLPVVAGGDPGAVLDELARMGLRRLGASSHGGEPYTEVDMRAPLALVLGNEASGLPSSLDHHIDARVSVPMTGGAESLNVSTAAAVLCFEVTRVRSNLPAMEKAQ